MSEYFRNIFFSLWWARVLICIYSKSVCNLDMNEGHFHHGVMCYHCRLYHSAIISVLSPRIDVLFKVSGICSVQRHLPSDLQRHYHIILSTRQGCEGDHVYTKGLCKSVCDMNWVLSRVLPKIFVECPFLARGLSSLWPQPYWR